MLLGNNINDDWVCFKDILFGAADMAIPKVNLNTKKRLDWLQSTTLQLIRKKRRAYKLAKRTKRDVDFHHYRLISNQVRHLTRQDHRQHLDEITKNLSTNQRPFWRWLKNMHGNSGFASPWQDFAS